MKRTRQGHHYPLLVRYRGHVNIQCGNSQEIVKMLSDPSLIVPHYLLTQLATKIAKLQVIKKCQMSITNMCTMHQSVTFTCEALGKKHNRISDTLRLIKLFFSTFNLVYYWNENTAFKQQSFLTLGHYPSPTFSASESK